MDSMTIAMLILLVLIFYFMIIRPENKRKKAAEDLRNGLKKGDKITTIGGIVGTIVQVNSDTIVIETSDDRVRMELTKWAVSTTGVQTSTEPAAAKKEKKKDAAEEIAPVEEKAEGKPAETTDEKKPYDPEL